MAKIPIAQAQPMASPTPRRPTRAPMLERPHGQDLQALASLGQSIQKTAAVFHGVEKRSNVRRAQLDIHAEIRDGLIEIEQEKDPERIRQMWGETRERIETKFEQEHGNRIGSNEISLIREKALGDFDANVRKHERKIIAANALATMNLQIADYIRQGDEEGAKQTIYDGHEDNLITAGERDTRLASVGREIDNWAIVEALDGLDQYVIFDSRDVEKEIESEIRAIRRMINESESLSPQDKDQLRGRAERKRAELQRKARDTGNEADIETRAEILNRLQDPDPDYDDLINTANYLRNPEQAAAWQARIKDRQTGKERDLESAEARAFKADAERSIWEIRGKLEAGILDHKTLDENRNNRLDILISDFEQIIIEGHRNPEVSDLPDETLQKMNSLLKDLRQEQMRPEVERDVARDVARTNNWKDGLSVIEGWETRPGGLLGQGHILDPDPDKARFLSAAEIRKNIEAREEELLELREGKGRLWWRRQLTEEEYKQKRAELYSGLLARMSNENAARIELRSAFRSWLDDLDKPPSGHEIREFLEDRLIEIYSQSTVERTDEGQIRILHHEKFGRDIIR